MSTLWLGGLSAKQKAEILLSASVCRKSTICSRSELLKSVFCPSSAGAKNTSIRTSVRIVGFADNECAQCGCSAEKSPQGLFRRPQTEGFVQVLGLVLWNIVTVRNYYGCANNKYSPI